MVKDRGHYDGLGNACTKCHRRYVNERRIFQAYGITKDQFDKLLKLQGGGCAICGTSKPGTRKGQPVRFSINHCHRTKVIRGILCSNCNNGLGRFKDNPDLLRAAIAYLSKSILKIGA
jgi:hypothetical protein